MTVTLTSAAITEALRRTILRRLAGNLDSTELSDANVDEMLNRYDSWAETQTNKTDWDGTEENFPTFVTASSLMASAEYLDGHPGVDPAKPGNQRIAARDAIKAINNKASESQVKPQMDIVVAGPNITDELNDANYIPLASETY